MAGNPMANGSTQPGKQLVESHSAGASATASSSATNGQPSAAAEGVIVRWADRMHRLPPYLFGKINAVLYAKRRAGEDVLDLGMGNPSDPPQELVINKLIEAARDPGNHRYSKSAGLLNLRKEIASKYMRKFGVRLDPDSQTLVCLGSKEGFSHMCLALMGPGDTAIVPAPYFPIHVYAVTLAAGNVITLDVSDSEKYLSNVAYTCENLFPRPKLLIVNYPHNPTTKCVEPEFFVDVVKIAKRYGLMVISDFAYGDVAFDGYQPPSFLAAPGALDVGVEFTTMSKGYNMAGWRAGYCCGNADMVKALATIKGYFDYGMFEPVQIASIVALRQTEAAVEAQAKIYERRRNVLCDGLSRLGWKIEPPKATMFVWTQVPEPWRSRMDCIEFATMLLEKGNVAVSPGTGFGPAGEGWLRLSLIENENRLKQSVKMIDRCLTSQAGGKTAPQPKGATSPM